VSPWKRLVGGRGGPWFLCAAFLGYAALLLPTLHYNFDEGVYIQQALAILDGKLPYRDYFYHQTPLYPFTLAAVGALLPDSLFVFRFVSLLATAVTGVFVHRVAAHFVPPPAALVAMLLFYVAPLQFYGLLALPLATMQLCCVAGVYLVVFSGRVVPVVCGSVLLALAILYRPLPVAVAIAVGVWLLARPDQRWKLGWVVGAGVLTGALAWVVFDLLSDGVFTELLRLQSSRYAQQGGFEKMMQFEPFRKIAFASRVRSAAGWNVNEHWRAFCTMGPLNGNLWLLLLGMAGQLHMWRRGGRWAGRRLLLGLWWLVPLVFSIWVWEPIWDHYGVQYLPPFAVLAAVYLHRLWSASRRPLLARVLAVTAVLAATVTGVGGVSARRLPGLATAMQPASVGETWLTFDPLVNFITGTIPACGLIDPFNVYGDRSLVALTDVPALSRYHVRADDLIRCLEAHPEAKIAFGAWAVWFAEPKLRAYVDGLAPARIVRRPGFNRR
jgi:hypothetical protein